MAHSEISGLSDDDHGSLDEEYIYGRWGRYQVFQVAIVCFHLLQTGFQLLMGVFIAYRPPGSRCAVVEFDNLTQMNSSLYVTYESCNIKVFYNDTTAQKLIKETGCLNGFWYTLDKDSTIVTEMDLVCDRAYLAEVLQSLVFVGQMVGAAFASSLSDRFGRKTVHLCSTLLTFIFGISVAFTQNYISLAILKFILGVLQQGMVVTGSVLSLELFPEKTRFYSEGLQALFWTSGLVIMAPIAFLMQNYSWRYLQITLTSFSALSLIQFWVQDESLRWLAVNGKYREAYRVVRKVARWNKLNYEDLKNIVDRRMARAEKDKCMMEDKKHSEKSKETIIVEKLTIVNIIKNKSIFIISVMMWFTWVTNSLTYFGLTLTSTSLAGNRFLNFFLSVCVEYIGGILEFIMLRCLGRRTITLIFHTITGTALALSTALNHFSEGSQPAIMTSVVTSFIGKLSITGSFSLLFLFTAELYPTNLRNAGLGISSSFSRVGAIVSPFVGLLAREIPWAPGTIFSSMCFIVVILAVYLPETRGWDLPQTMAEVKVWYKEKSGFRLQKGRRRTETLKVLDIK